MGVALEILKILREEPRHTSGTLQKRLNVSRSSVKIALMTLADVGLVTQEVRGVYGITPLGREVLDQSLKKTES